MAHLLGLMEMMNLPITEKERSFKTSCLPDDPIIPGPRDPIPRPPGPPGPPRPPRPPGPRILTHPFRPRTFC